MKLERTMTIAEGKPKCDFRYSRKWTTISGSVGYDWLFGCF